VSRNAAIVVLAAAFLATASGCDTFRTRGHIKAGDEHYKGQRYEEAVREYQEAQKGHPDDWDINYRIAISYLAMYHPGSTHAKDVAAADGAIAALEKLLKLEAPSAEYKDKVRAYYLGILTSTEKSGKAIEYLEGELAKSPNNTALIAQIAGLYGKQGDFENSLKYFQRNAELEPSKKETWYTIGVLCWDRSYKGGVTVSNEERAIVVDQGLAALDKALAIDRDYFDALSYVNLLYREKYKVLVAMGDMEGASQAQMKAEEYFKRAVELKKKQAPAKGA
jgi:tetratricopeptide (TPR) repeat protein